MSMLKSHSGWKTKHFMGMTLEEIREKFIPVWKQIEDFVPMTSKEEGERMKRKGLRLGGSTTVYQFCVDMLKHFNREDLIQLWTLVKETGRIVRNKMLKSFSLPVMKFPLPEYFPTASEEMFLLLSQRDALLKKFALLMKSRINCGQRHINNSQRRVSFILGRCPMIVAII
nr:hypothetical protein [Tanacetum cinerariifolium]